MAEHVAHTVHVDAMLDGMTHEQFAEWCAKDMIEPIGTVRVHATEQRQPAPQEPASGDGGLMALEAVGWRKV